ncbi:MAG: hypothetical protein CMN68_00005 [Sphingomonadaceae bacterium]|nr:hypothetical protein [Sphingomonadaceae bacterium]
MIRTKVSLHFPSRNDPMTAESTPWCSMPAFAVLTLALIAGPPTRADNNQDAPSCVTVEIDGHKALPYDCYQRKMAPSSVPERGTPAMHSATVAEQAPNRLGLFNLSTLRNRMGNTLGQGVRPQRPPAPPPLP